MLTIKTLGGSGISFSDGKAMVAVFAKKPVANAVNLMQKPEEEPTVGTISWPGEYDVDGVAIRGIGQLEGQQVSYVLAMDGVRSAALSSPLLEWGQHDLESLGDVQLLVLPAENLKEAQALIDEVDPRVLIIVPGNDGTMHPDVLKAAGAADKEAMSEYKLKGALPAEGRETVILSAS